MSTDPSGKCLQKAVELSNSNVWRVRLAESITSVDAHAIDVLYRLKCWTTNVRNVLRKMQTQDTPSNSNAATIALDI